MPNKFHVLILDDSREVIRELKSRISPQHSIAGSTWHVAIDGVHVETKHESDNVAFSDETLRSLVAACNRTPDVILADYGFASQEQSEKLHNGSLSPEQFMDSILTAPDLVPAVESFVKRKHPADKHLPKTITAALRNNRCPLYLYTYTPLQFKKALPTVDARAKQTQKIFSQSVVIPLDTTVEFYGNDRFADKHDKDFYAYLVTGLLDQIIQRELLKFVLDRENERLRFVRYYRSGAGVLVIVLIGAGVGAFGEWVGARIIDLVTHGVTLPCLGPLITRDFGFLG